MIDDEAADRGLKLSPRFRKTWCRVPEPTGCTKPWFSLRRLLASTELCLLLSDRPIEFSKLRAFRVLCCLLNYFVSLVSGC
jgi:hypothetical protein